MNRFSVGITCLAIAFGFTVPATAKTILPKPAQVAAIHSVTIADSVPMPKEMFFQGRGQSMNVGGAIMGGISNNIAKKEPKEQIVETMQANKIDLPTIVKAEFAKALQNAGPITVAAGDEKADASIDVEVEMYGLGQTQGFSALLYPVLTVKVKLTQSDGTVIWQRSDYITPQNKENTGGHKFEEYMQQPELLRETWTNISGIVSRLLVKSLYPPIKK